MAEARANGGDLVMILENDRLKKTQGPSGLLARLRLRLLADGPRDDDSFREIALGLRKAAAEPILHPRVGG